MEMICGLRRDDKLALANVCVLVNYIKSQQYVKNKNKKRMKSKSLENKFLDFIST